MKTTDSCGGATGRAGLTPKYGAWLFALLAGTAFACGFAEGADPVTRKGGAGGSGTGAVINAGGEAGLGAGGEATSTGGGGSGEGAR